MLAPGDRIGVAVSGGSDSVALLNLLLELRGMLGITLVVLHFDHMLRAAESDKDMQFVAELTRRNRLELIQERADVAAEAKKHRWNIEDAGRRLRYAFFERMISEGKAMRVAVAHTADDQAETVLMHMLQGTGLTGLAGIHPLTGFGGAGASKKQSIVRPLLDIRREELREYLRAKRESWREDSSNRDVRRFRARIRRDLIPLLEREFSAQTVTRLCRLARLAREDEEFWGTLVDAEFRNLVSEKEGRLRIGVRDLLAPLGSHANLTISHELMPPPAENAPWRALTERLIRRLYEGVRGDLRGLTAKHVDQVIHLAKESESGRRLELPGGVLVERSFRELVFSRTAKRGGRRSSAGETDGSRTAFHYVVELPERGATVIPVPELKRRFRLKVIDWPAGRRDTKSDYPALDADLLCPPLVLRNWRPGDAYRPQGRRNVQKLKRLFLAGRVPSPERAQWPVLESKGRVAWVRGMPPADDFCANAKTRSGVTIEEDQI